MMMFGIGGGGLIVGRFSFRFVKVELPPLAETFVLRSRLLRDDVPLLGATLEDDEENGR